MGMKLVPGKLYRVTMSFPLTNAEGFLTKADREIKEDLHAGWVHEGHVMMFVELQQCLNKVYVGYGKMFPVFLNGSHRVCVDMPYVHEVLELCEKR